MLKFFKRLFTIICALFREKVSRVALQWQKVAFLFPLLLYSYVHMSINKYQSIKILL